MRDGIRAALGFATGLVAATGACAQWCGESTMRDWTIGTRFGPFGYEETWNICTNGTTHWMVLGPIGMVRMTRGGVALGAIAALFVGLCACELVKLRGRMKRRPSGEVLVVGAGDGRHAG